MCVRALLLPKYSFPDKSEKVWRFHSSSGSSIERKKEKVEEKAIIRKPFSAKMPKISLKT